MSRTATASTAIEGSPQLKAFQEIEGLLLQALRFPSFRRRWALTRMRQGFAPAPVCFLWSNRRHGVHALEVRDTRLGSNLLGLGPYLWFRLGIKYYPHPKEPVFEEFSVIERLLRLGPAFGEQDVPTPASSRQLRPGSFTVRFIECAVQDKRALTWPLFPPLVAAFCLESSARLRSAMTATRPALTVVTMFDGTIQETPASDTLERRYDACLLPTADPEIGRRIDQAMERLAGGADAADSTPDNRPWQATRIPITRGRKTLPPLPGRPPS